MFSMEAVLSHLYFCTEFTITTDLSLLEGGGAVVEVRSPLRLEGLGCRLHRGQRLEVRSLGGNIQTKIMEVLVLC